VKATKPFGVPSQQVKPACVHFGTCGGCDLQDIAYDEQLRQKRQRVVVCLDGLVAADRVAPCVASSDPDAAWGFRRKAHFVFTDQSGQLALAHHAKGGRSLVRVRECPAHAPEGNRIAEALRAALDASGVKAHPQGPLRHIVVRALRSGGPAVVTLVVTRDGDPRVRRAVGRFLDAQPGRVSIYINVNDARSSYLFGEETRHVAGPKRAVERVNGVDYLISATSFFQTNVDAAESVVKLVVEGLGRAHPGDAAVDLYAGVGLFALQLVRAGYKVLAVEENPSAVADGIASLHENGILASRCRYVRSPVRRVDAWSRNLPSGPVAALVLDPPRTGVGPALLREILTTTAPVRVAYVSCDPESLARDLAALSAARGRSLYHVDSVIPVDMFPQTEHVETVVRMTRRET
jgi:23S rRNA (uracil1939-C5)-methyltransferase